MGEIMNTFLKILDDFSILELLVDEDLTRSTACKDCR